MSMESEASRRDRIAAVLPRRRQLFYDGSWHESVSGRRFEVRNPANGDSLGEVSEAGPEDADEAVRAACRAFALWRRVPPLERAAKLRETARRLRANVAELALLDAADCGNPVRAMAGDVNVAATFLDYYAGLVTEVKGETVPMGPGVVNYTVREPLGVVVRIVPFNHPLMFAAMKIAAPLATGNAVILKPPEQAPLSALRLAELVEDLYPPGVVNVLNGGKTLGAALSAHPLVRKVAVIGSVPTGRAVMRSGAETVKQLTLELGGKNALIAYPDADPVKVAAGAVFGMNLSWTAGQSCGATSRVFLHSRIYDETLRRIVDAVSRIHPSIPTDDDCEMGCLVSREQYEKVVDYIRSGTEEGAHLMCGGGEPADPRLKRGTFIEPAVLADVRQSMRVAREESFGPVMCVLRWEDEEEMFAAVNSVEQGLTASIWTRDLAAAHHAAARVEAGYVWINASSSHFLGVPFGGYKQSGFGREECFEELLSYTQVKNVHVKLEP
jgi:betaine-aldehyde dehydrogenase